MKQWYKLPSGISLDRALHITRDENYARGFDLRDVYFNYPEHRFGY